MSGTVASSGHVVIPADPINVDVPVTPLQQQQMELEQMEPPHLHPTPPPANPGPAVPGALQGSSGTDVTSGATTSGSTTTFGETGQIVSLYGPRNGALRHRSHWRERRCRW